MGTADDHEDELQPKERDPKGDVIFSLFVKGHPIAGSGSVETPLKEPTPAFVPCLSDSAAIPLVAVGDRDCARIVSAVEAGRILNEKLARSQIIGGAVMGIGMATALRTAYRSSWPPTASAWRRPGRPGTRLVQTVGRVTWGRPAIGKPGVALAPSAVFDRP